MKNIVMYWHNGRSLGHTAESSKIANGILQSKEENLHIVGLTGAKHGLDLFDERVDIVKMPGFKNFDTDTGYHEESLQGMDISKLFNLRAQMAKLFLETYNPDYLLVNHTFKGMKNELVDSLNSFRNEKILTLRGVLFDKNKTENEFFSGEGKKYLEDIYSKIIVNIDPSIFSLEENYNIPPAIKKKLVYAGYLNKRKIVNKAVIRNKLNIDIDEKVIVANMGGGQGAMYIWENLIKALIKISPHFDKVIVFTGPYLEKENFITLKSISDRYEWLIVQEYTSRLEEYMAASDLFIGAAGSNTINEVISSNINSVLIPRQIRESEQDIHSEVLRNKGFIRKIKLEDIADINLVSHEIYLGLVSPLQISNDSLLLDGASRYLKLL